MVKRLTSQAKDQYLATHLINDCILVGDMAKADTFYSRKPIDLDVSTVGDERIKKVLTLACRPLFSLKSAGQYFEAIRLFIATMPECTRNDYPKFVRELIHATAGDENRSKFYRTWYRNMLIAELLGIPGSEARNAYINHCVDHKILDVFGPVYLLNKKCELSDSILNRNMCFHDVSWLTDEMIVMIAEFIFDSVKNDAYPQAILNTIVRDFVKYREDCPVEAQGDLASFFNWLVEKHPRSHFTIGFSEYNKNFLAQENTLLKMDTWRVEWFPNRDKLKVETACHMVHFGGIEDEKSRYYCKKYFLYLFSVTDKSERSISSELIYVLKFFREVNKAVDEIDTDTILNYASDLYAEKYDQTGSSGKAQVYVANVMRILSHTFDYFVAHEYIEMNHFHYVRAQYKADATKPARPRKPISPYVLNQIFKVLYNCECYEEILIFLVMFDTGLRVSDAVSLRRSDLVVHGKTVNGAFRIEGAELHYYNHKFNHEAVVFMSSTVAMLLDAHRTRTSGNSFFMFPSKSFYDHHISSRTFREDMQEFFRQNNITNEDGTPFSFIPHELRHTCACRLYALGVPVAAISQQLDHQSVDMTIRYVDTLEAKTFSKNQSYVDSHGNNTTLKGGLLGNFGDISNISKALDKLNASILPNGYCRRPNALGACENYCACINMNCPHFFTDESSLRVHEQQYEANRKIADDPTRSLPERETARHDMETLEKIIRAIRMNRPRSESEHNAQERLS